MLPKIDKGAGVAIEIQQIYMFLILQWHVLMAGWTGGGGTGDDGAGSGERGDGERGESGRGTGREGDGGRGGGVGDRGGGIIINYFIDNSLR